MDLITEQKAVTETSSQRGRQMTSLLLARPQHASDTSLIVLAAQLHPVSLLPSVFPRTLRRTSLPYKYH